jgi:xanthine dehydrogenase accessory factor
MRDVLTPIMQWWTAGEEFGLATVVRTLRSAPRPAGAAMAVLGDEAVGSVSGGCVEGAVYELAREVTGTGRTVVQRYGVSGDDAFTVSLTCGGILDIMVERVSRDSYPELGEIAASVTAREPVAVATITAGPGEPGARRVIWPDRASGTLHSRRLEAAVGICRLSRRAVCGRSRPITGWDVPVVA